MGPGYKANQQLVSSAGAQRYMTSIDYLEPGSFMTVCTCAVVYSSFVPRFPLCARFSSARAVGGAWERG